MVNHVTVVGPGNTLLVNVPFRRQKRRRKRVKKLSPRPNLDTKEKSVTILTPADVCSPPVLEYMRVSRAGAVNPRSGAPVTIEARPLLDSKAWEICLAHHHDRNFVNKIVHYTKFGVPIGHNGPRISRVHKNSNSAYKYGSAVKQVLLYDVQKGTKVGPFNFPPFGRFVGSPLGAFPRKRSNKYRVIHDLSWPPGQSVNDYISAEDSSVQYISFDYVVQKVLNYGAGAMMAKLDILDTYKHILVRPDDWDLLGCTWTDPHTGLIEYYIDLTLPFSLRSSAKLFTEFAYARKLCMEYDGTTDVEHYLDDYVTIGPPDSSVAANNLDIMLSTCSFIGFEVSPPNSVMEFLGIVIDSRKQEVRISEDRLRD